MGIFLYWGYILLLFSAKWLSAIRYTVKHVISPYKTLITVANVIGKFVFGLLLLPLIWAFLPPWCHLLQPLSLNSATYFSPLASIVPLISASFFPMVPLIYFRPLASKVPYIWTSASRVTLIMDIISVQLLSLFAMMVPQFEPLWHECKTIWASLPWVCHNLSLFDMMVPQCEPLSHEGSTYSQSQVIIYWDWNNTCSMT